MHQTPRQGPRPSSPATSPRTNPQRTNNPRDQARLSAYPRTGSEPASPRGSSTPVGSGDRNGQGPSKDSIKKLDQIIQNIFAKAGTLIIQERMKVTPILFGKTQERRTSRWFQIDTDEIEDFREELRTWKLCGGFENQPPPMVIETYLDTSKLRRGQSLVILDENGKRWDVVEALNSSDLSGDSSYGRLGKSSSHVTLERWRVHMNPLLPDEPAEFGPILPTVYKKAIVLFRSIYTTTGVLPAWRLTRNSKKIGVHPALQVRCRVASVDSHAVGPDPLRTPLYEGRGDVSTDTVFGDLELPVGRIYASVSYRNNCDFRIVETESLLSSRIGLAISDDLFKPSLANRGDGRRESSAGIGSLPYHRHMRDITENQQRYGSLSTFHGEGPAGTSPISALRQVKAPGSDTSSPPDSRPASVENHPHYPPHSLPIMAPNRLALRGHDGLERRQSVTLQPFKMGSLSSSPGPRTQDMDVPASPRSISRGSGISNALTTARNRSSLTAGRPASLRTGTPSVADPPVVGSPRPSSSNRFSSSFTHRRSKTSFGGSSRVVDEDQTSSGRQSLSSSLAQPGSGLLNEVGAGGSSGSVQTDDDNIQEFLKALESKKTLQSFEPSGKSGESATKRTSAQLSKFHLMRESNNALTESMNSSMQLQRSSSSSSRQLANVPGMSTSSSPGMKPLSPHTPHTPAVPSRLSENSSVDYHASNIAIARERGDGRISTTDGTASVPVTQDGTPAIDIPLSPRPYPHVRRSSYVGQQQRHILDEDEVQRSISLGANDRETPSITALRRHGALTDGVSGSPILQAPTDSRASDSSEMLRQGSSSMERETQPPGALLTGLPTSSYGKRYGTSAGRGNTPPLSGNSSLSGPSNRYSKGYPRGGVATGPGAGSGPSDEVEEEPLLFDMSEIGREHNRRSMEEGRGGGSLGSTGDRGSYGSPRGSRRWP